MAPTEPFSPYHRRLFVFLSVATFFEGYDFMAITQVLPNLRGDLGLVELSWTGIIIGVTNLGTVIAYALIRRADRWGRRRVLTITIVGYTLFTFVTALSPNIVVFIACQLVARIFLIGEWAISNVIAAEEFPASRRGVVLGVIGACSSLGSILCAGVVPLLLRTPLGWRSVYLVGILPLLVLAWARRDLRETKRFEIAGAATEPSLFRIFRTPYRGRLLKLAAVWAVAYVASQNAVAFWKEFAVAERGLTDAQVGGAIALASVTAMPLVFGVGYLIDAIGRRRGAAIVFTLGAIGTFLSYTLHGQWPLTFALILGVFGVSAYLPILNAYNNELFPTDLRGDAYAWANNLLGRVSYVLSPLAVGFLAERTGELGPIVAVTPIFTIVAMVLVLLWFPETRNRELEETAIV